ncbi:MAG: hypothetical protein M5U09_19605 [Gammaproteobacteria bacterium]|nr:hypothetical protein [Gammaproteobacteria bacterium]
MTADLQLVVQRPGDGYAGAIDADTLFERIRFARRYCRAHGAANARQCAIHTLRSLLCPCAWNEECIVNAIESEMLRSSG